MAGERVKRRRGDTCKWRCCGSTRDNERHGLFILSKAATPAPLPPPPPHRRSVLKHISTDWISSHAFTNALFIDFPRPIQAVYVCVQETQVQPIMRRFLSGSGRVSTNHKVNIRRPRPGLPVRLLKLPIKAELAACSRRNRIYLSCSNWWIVAVRGWDWVVHHVPTEGCRRERSSSQARRIGPHEV